MVSAQQQNPFWPPLMWMMDVRASAECLQGFIFVFQLTKHAPASLVRLQPSNRKSDYDDQTESIRNKGHRDKGMDEKRRTVR